MFLGLVLWASDLLKGSKTTWVSSATLSTLHALFLQAGEVRDPVVDHLLIFRRYDSPIDCPKHIINNFVQDIFKEELMDDDLLSIPSSGSFEEVTGIQKSLNILK